jgi:hypothetical protein
MNWRKLLLSLTVAAGLSLTLVPRPTDPWFWQQRHERYERYRDGDRFGWFSHWRYDHDGDRPYRYRYDHDGYRPTDTTTIATRF